MYMRSGMPTPSRVMRPITAGSWVGDCSASMTASSPASGARPARSTAASSTKLS